MKTFKKLFLSLFMIPFLFLFPMRAYAEEITSVVEDEIVSPIYGMDAFIRDYKDENVKEVNIREKPTESSKVLTTIPLYEHLTIIDQTGKWFEVQYGDISGFVYWKYVQFVEPEIVEDSNLIGNSIIHYTSSENRDINIAIACNTINGLVLNPEDEFRWSSVVGQANAEKGYLKATVIIGGKPVPGFGGGVCQVSTTLYNALLDTSIEPTEHHKHSIGSAYAENDATVAYGLKDFAFTNTYDFPIKIETYSYKSVIFVNFYRVEEE